MVDEPDYYKGFADKGEKRVREDLAAKRYGEESGPKVRAAKEWLRREDQERSNSAERRKEASSLEQNRIARSAKNAAWAAAIAAIIAAIIATICAVITVALYLKS